MIDKSQLSPAHITINYKARKLVCLKCFKSRLLGLPIRAEIMLRIQKAFEREHKKCGGD